MAATCCAGFRCLDRDECYAYDEALKSAAFAHDGGSCFDVLGHDALRFQYRTREGELTTIWCACVLRWAAACASLQPPA